jgi:glycine/D-amino acid oxidase-like deaminating enzyme
VARFLIVGCGCRGQSLARELVAAGHVVRGTTRDPARLAAIEAAGAEGVMADPYRLATVMPLLDGASAVCWLMGTANGSEDAVEAVHGPRLESMLELIVDTHARGFLYETGGVDRETGLHATACAREVYGMPIEVLAADPGDHERWLGEAREAALRLLGS